LPKFKDVHANVNLASRNFYEDWEKWWTSGANAPLAQPQIDLLFVGTDLRLLAVEVKYHHLSENAPLNHPHYSGIEEALALLRFGFNCVSLWQFFDSEIPDEVWKRYVNNCFYLTTGLNQLPRIQGVWPPRRRLQENPLVYIKRSSSQLSPKPIWHRKPATEPPR
jgi:hypothetical protein